MSEAAYRSGSRLYLSMRSAPRLRRRNPEGGRRPGLNVKGVASSPDQGHPCFATRKRCRPCRGRAVCLCPTSRRSKQWPCSCHAGTRSERRGPRETRHCWRVDLHVARFRAETRRRRRARALVHTIRTSACSAIPAPSARQCVCTLLGSHVSANDTAVLTCLLGASCSV